MLKEIFQTARLSVRLAPQLWKNLGQTLASAKAADWTMKDEMPEDEDKHKLKKLSVAVGLGMVTGFAWEVAAPAMVALATVKGAEKLQELAENYKEIEVEKKEKRARVCARAEGERSEPIESERSERQEQEGERSEPQQPINIQPQTSYTINDQTDETPQALYHIFQLDPPIYKNSQCRYARINYYDDPAVLVEQNPKKDTWCAKLAQEGRELAWLISHERGYIKLFEFELREDKIAWREVRRDETSDWQEVKYED